ncbi:MAG: SGNH/GDSL hydrolase family protein [Syntrophomonadaceae bacterium]
MAQPEGFKVVCLGDSITWGFPYGPEYSWVTMLDEILEAEFINEGINGNTTDDMLRRFYRCVIKHEPTHLVILGGANDVLWQESIDRIVYNLQAIAQKAGEAGIKVIMATPTAINHREVERRLDRIRDWIKGYARENNLPVIDFAAAYFAPDGSIRSDLLLLDGAHPNKNGYRAMFEQIDLNIFRDMKI